MDALVPTLEEVSHPVVPLVIFEGIDAVEVGHERREVFFRGFEYQVVMVIHQNPGVAKDMVFFDGFSQ